MLEVGRVTAPAPDAFYSWNRAHFGAWCVVSAPLILGLELSDAKLGPVLDIIGNEEAIAVNQRYVDHPGLLVQNIEAPPQPYQPGGVVVPSSSAADVDALDGASIGASRADAKTSGVANIRTGVPGQVSTIMIGYGLLAHGYSIDSVSLSFRYTAGYTGSGSPATVVLQLLDLESRAVLKTLAASPPLGNYSYDHFTGYSPPVALQATGVGVPNSKPVILALQVTNHQRNLQIPIDDLANGFDVHVAWTPSAARSVTVETEGMATGHGKVAHHHEAGSSPESSLRAALGVFGVGQLWAKRQPGGASAALLINHSPRPLKFVIQLAKLNLTASNYQARDIWARKDIGSVSSEITLSAPGYDSAFVLLSPASSVATSRRL